MSYEHEHGFEAYIGDGSDTLDFGDACNRSESPDSVNTPEGSDVPDPGDGTSDV